MIAYFLPVALIIVSNIIYQIAAKSVPGTLNPFASMIVTYAVGTVVSAILYFLLNKGGNLLQEYQHLNWAPFALGIIVVGLEVGFIYAYKAGWPVSTLSIVQSAFLAVALIVVGALLYHEAITWNKIVGIVFCLLGLAFINK